MALEFQDFGLSPDERVEQREKALESFTNVAQPAFQKKVGAERGQLISDVESAVAKAAMKGQPGAAQSVMGEAAQRAAQMIPQQGQEQDALNLRGAQMRADITFSRQDAAIAAYNRETAERKSKAADYISKQAFNLGYSSKELAMHRDGYLADKGLEQMYYDLEQGRISQREVFELQSKLKLQAQELQQETEQMLKKLEDQLKSDLQEMNIAAAKNRLLELYRRQKEAARKAAEAAQLGAIIGGVATIGGAAAGAYFGGPAGASLGARAGGAFGNVATTAAT